MLATGHANRNFKWAERFRSDGRDGDGGDGVENLYEKHSGKGGRPPTSDDLAALRYAAEQSGRTHEG